MLTTTRRKAAGLNEPGCIGGNGLNSLLRVIERLLREPNAVEAVLLNGTKAVPSRYLYPPAVAEDDSDQVERKQDYLREDYALLRQLISERRQKERERQQKQPGDSVTSATPTVRLLTTPKPEPLPEVGFYIGALKLALGFRTDNVPADSSAATINEGINSTTNGSSLGTGVDGKSWIIVQASWPPEYILETVVQSQSSSAGFELGGGDTDSDKQQGLVVVSSVNCGYIDVAVNFLLSLRRSAINVKVRFDPCRCDDPCVWGCICVCWGL